MPGSRLPQARTMETGTEVPDVTLELPVGLGVPASPAPTPPPAPRSAPRRPACFRPPAFSTACASSPGGAAAKRRGARPGQADALLSQPIRRPQGPHAGCAIASSTQAALRSWGDAFPQQRLAARELGQHRLAADLVDLVEPIDGLPTEAERRPGLRDTSDLLRQLQQPAPSSGSASPAWSSSFVLSSSSRNETPKEGDGQIRS